MGHFIAAVQHDSYGTVINNFDAHMSTKTPASNFQTGNFYFFNKAVEQLLSDSRQSGT